MPPTVSRRVNIGRTIQVELAPFPGRLFGSLRDTLGITVAVVIAMTLRVPGISLALALLFLLQRERPGLTLRSSSHIFSGAVMACVASLFWVQITDGTDVARFLGVAGGIFLAGFGMSATTFPLFFTIFGFYGFLDLSAWDAHRGSSAIVASSLYNLASLAIVLLASVAVEYLFGIRHPAEELRQEIQKRLNVLSRFFHSAAKGHSGDEPDQLRRLQSELVRYAHAGDRDLNKLYNRLRDASSDVSQVPIGIHYRIGLLTRILEKSALLSLAHPPASSNYYYFAAIAEQCDQLLGGNAISSERLPDSAPPYLRDISAELLQYSASDEPDREVPATTSPSAERHTFLAGFFLPGVFQTPDAVTYALKLAFAATLCYIFYNAIAWPGILTCVVTVLFTGLSSTGAMKQKQLYRFAGAAIGGLLGIATVSLLFPNMDSITTLVVVVGAVSFVCAWVLRSPHMGYVGVQIGFAFFLTTLPGFSAATLISPARDRVIGIGIGIVVMWFVFDQLWPMRTSAALRHTLQRIRESTVELRRATTQKDMANAAETLSKLRAAVSLELVNVQQLESAAFFDFGQGHKRELASSRRLIHQIESAAAEFYSEALRSRSEASPQLP